MSFGYCHFDHFDTMMIHSLILTSSSTKVIVLSKSIGFSKTILQVNNAVPLMTFKAIGDDDVWMNLRRIEWMHALVIYE